jgi:CRP-like cAMP-binding protein
VGAAYKEDRKNRLLMSLTPADALRLTQHLVPVRLKFRQRLEVANRAIECVYFLESGLASVCALSQYGRRQAEVAVIGCEGMTGQSVVLGDGRAAHDIWMQSAGSGFSIDVGLLRDLMRASPSMTRIFQRFAQVIAVQIGHTALVNADGTNEERLARRLLMSHDRLGVDHLQVTHEFLAQMLGVRRPSVTIARQDGHSRSVRTRVGGQRVVRRARGRIHASAHRPGCLSASHEVLPE